MLVVRGTTTHFTISYENTLPNGLAMANAQFASCEADWTTLEGLWAPMAAPSSFQVTIVAGSGGASTSARTSRAR